MTTNKKLTITGVIIIFLLITIPTTYKVINNHYNHLTQVVESKIIEAAKKCYYEEICKDDKITLKELYKLDYLEPVSNPISKEYYNEESYVEINDNKFKFIVKSD